MIVLKKMGKQEVSNLVNCFFLMCKNPIGGLHLHIIEGSQSHSDTRHLVRLLWTSDKPLAVIYLTTHNTHYKQTFMPPARFEPAIP